MRQEAFFVVETLRKAGFVAYFAGGCVRDHLLGLPWSDIDIATNASVEQIESLFNRTEGVGRAFGVMLVMWGGECFEVSTFREDVGEQGGRYPQGVVSSTPRQDALRRDLTINGMFWDPFEEKVIDYVGGVADLQAKRLRAIGDARQRICEDRLRILRAVRFQVRFPEFTIDPALFVAMRDYAGDVLDHVSIERVWVEIKKMAQSEHWPLGCRLLHALGLAQQVFAGFTWTGLEARLDRVEACGQRLGMIFRLVWSLGLQEEGVWQEWIERMKGSKREKEQIEYAQRVMRQEVWSRQTLVEMLSHELAEDAVIYVQSRGHDLSVLRKELAEAVKRRQGRKTLVRAQTLQRLGVKPGPQLGQLLRDSEALAIEQQLDQEQEVIEAMRQRGWI